GLRAPRAWRAGGCRDLRSAGGAARRARGAEEPGQAHALCRLRACRSRALHPGRRKPRVRGMRRLAAALAIALAACSSSPKKGAYYKDDGPGANPPSNLASIPDARPRGEPLHKYANRPYEVFGKKYVP